ncbi:MAG TPA: M15 family metallopeptidase [Thermoleophilaceae bacterium]
MAVDPRAYAAALPQAERRDVARLGRGETLLSATSARLRKVRTGGTLTLIGGRRLRVAGVLPDPLAQSAEIVVDNRDARVETAARNVVALLKPDADISAAALARRAGDGARARLVLDRSEDRRGPASGGPARPAELKARFGEPSVALPYGQDWVRLDRGFVRRNIVTRRVPILGSVTCHRDMVPALRAAMSELERRGLAGLVDPGDYAGCYAPRRIQPGGALSLHAWGLAVDLNASANPFGGRSHQDRRLVRTVKRHGFTWGGEWPSIHDPMHFEFRGR